MEIPAATVGQKRAVLITGPTASGKSAAALRLAQDLAGSGRRAVIVNADSMQVYEGLRVLTARPSREDEARAPHRLFGHVAPSERYSVGRWLADVAPVLSEAWGAGKLPILVGGTGLYFKALTQGLAATPEIPAAVRRRWARRLGEEGPERLHDALRRLDPPAAAAIPLTDPQRLVRALEVIDATGRSIRDWQGETGPPLMAPETARRLILLPDRGALYRRIEERFDVMIAAGATDEVRALLARRLDPELPVMKATGVRELADYLAGRVTLEEAVARAKAETRRYAKRQMTWLRTQLGPGWMVLREKAAGGPA